MDFLKVNTIDGLGEVNMPLLMYVFKPQIRSYFKTKMLTKNING